jgi:hypothetical protein
MDDYAHNSQALPRLRSSDHNAALKFEKLESPWRDEVVCMAT